MNKKRLALQVLLAVVGMVVATIILETLTGVVRWIIAGAVLAPTVIPMMRTLYIWSTAKALAREARRSNGG